MRSIFGGEHKVLEEALSSRMWHMEGRIIRAPLVEPLNCSDE